MMDKIMIIGCGGSGKSTLGRALALKLSLPLVHLDQLNWRDNWSSVGKEEFDRLQQAELQNNKWIIDGNYNRTIPLRLQYCDTVIYLDYSRLTCLLGVIKRVLTNRGKSRPDMAENCPERFNLEFLKFVWNFNKKNRQKYYDMLKTCDDDIKVIIMKNRKDTRKFVNEL